MRPAARRILASGLLFVVATAPGFGVNLSISGRSAGPGASILIPISFADDGQSVSGVQFDLVFDSTALSLVPIVGGVARTCGKTIYLASLKANLTRVLITELNQNQISDGSLVNLFVNIAPTALAGAYSIHF